MTASLSFRLATLGDVPALQTLIARSVNSLQADDYSEAQRAKALGSVFGIDRQLIRDGTYYIAEEAGGIVACGGWSRRKTLFGADAVANRDDDALDPALDPARIRAFYVDPDCARRGIGTQLLEVCEAAAVAQGFTRLELASTLTGIPLYRRRGYAPLEPVEVPLPGGGSLTVLRMIKERR
ncbi:MAG TPA: GNAT family N-acetyltransferase [Aliidongia sp.]|nr:GNAT family N-acetyltransferase [Aliidongia sp.]